MRPDASHDPSVELVEELSDVGTLEPVNTMAARAATAMPAHTRGDAPPKALDVTGQAVAGNTGEWDRLGWRQKTETLLIKFRTLS